MDLIRQQVGKGSRKKGDERRFAAGKMGQGGAYVISLATLENTYGTYLDFLSTREEVSHA